MQILHGVLGQQVAAGGGGSVAPEVVLITTYGGANATTHNVGLGPTYASGDLILVFASTDGGSADTPATSASGWTRISTGGNSLVGRGIFKKLADGSEGGKTVAFTIASSEHMSAHIYRINSWGGTVATHVAIADTADTSEANLTTPCAALTSGFGAVPTLWIASLHNSSTEVMTSGPSGYSAMLESGEGSANNGITRSVFKQITAASETPPSWNWEWRGFANVGATVAVKGT